MSNSTYFPHFDFWQKVEFLCCELDFDDQIVSQIKQILKNSQTELRIELQKIPIELQTKETDLQSSNSKNSAKTVTKNLPKLLNPQLQIEKIDLKSDLENGSTNNLEIASNLVKVKIHSENENQEKTKEKSQELAQNLQIPNEQKTQIQNLIKQEYAKINGQKIEQIEIDLQNYHKSLDKTKIPQDITAQIDTKEEEKFNLDFKNLDNLDNLAILPNDMAYVRGQIVAKRALEIAASGGHNVLFLGSPGSGKTLLARAYGGILPAMTEQEILEATQIYSVAGLLAKGEIIHKRPFRSPHHSASHVALVGGGSKIRPGEASLAHRGVLFLDEFPEFGRDTIEALRQPLEDGFVSIARASGSLIFPSKFYLLAAANPTPSGFDPDDPDALNKPQNRAAISRYQARFSGPIMDRIDIHVEVSRPKSEELQSTILAEKSYQIAKRVQLARNIQTQRFADYYKDKSNLTPIQSNSEMNLPMIQKFCVLDTSGQKLLSNAIERFKLSARAYMRLLKLSRTIADLNSSENIQTFHLAESLQYRGRWS